MLRAQTAVPDERAAHAAVMCPEGIPFIAFEGCRERLGERALPGYRYMRVGWFADCVAVVQCVVQAFSRAGLNSPMGAFHVHKRQSG